MKPLYKKLVRRFQIEMKNVYQKKCLLTCKNSTEAFSHAAKKSWERLKEHEQAVLLFAKEEDIHFKNKRAENYLCMLKVKQKVSGCFRNIGYAYA